MSSQQSFYFDSANGESRVFARVFLPASKPDALLQIVHGMAEHGGLYQEFADYLTYRGWAVAVHDQIGHGLSVAKGQRYGFLAEQNGWQAALKDIDYLRRTVSHRWAGLPCFMLGHSMGSFLLRSYLIEYAPTGLSGVILSGSGQMPALLLRLGSLMIGLEKRRLGCKGLSPLLCGLIQGGYNRRFRPNRTPVDWLSSDTAMVDAYYADKLCRKLPTVGLYSDIYEALCAGIRPENLRRMLPAPPILFVSGSEDPVGHRGKSVARLMAAFQQAGITDLRLKLYEGGRHAMLYEQNRQEVFADIWQWLWEKMSENEGEA